VISQHSISKPEHYIGDPELIGHLMTTKNLKFDRDPLFEMLMLPLFGKSFLFSQSNAHWKKLRKACSNAFYKDRIDIMIGSIKNKLAMSNTQWMHQMEKSPDGALRVDLRHAPKGIFERIMSEIVMGYDFCDDKIVFRDVAVGMDGIRVVDREMTMIESGGRIVE
jgi:cytochrome P450